MPVYTKSPEADQTPRPSRAERRRRQRDAAKMTAEELRHMIGGGLDALGMELALENLRQMMEEDADALAGAPKGKHSPKRQAHRHGYVAGFVSLCGRKVSVLRPRLRGRDQGDEVVLPSYLWAQDEASLSRAAVRGTILGVAQRRHPAVIEAMVETPEGMQSRGISKSSVSRRFVAATETTVQSLLERRLDQSRYLALYIDGVAVGDHCVLVVMGLTEDGRKEILGLAEGTVENAEVCRELLEDLKRRGLSAARGLLVVIDGAKALAAAVKQVFGDRAAVQRCCVHKRRNVLDKLPERARGWVKQAMEEAWRAESASHGQAALEHLADRLENEGHDEAAASLREGLFQTFTCLRLGVDPTLLPTLSNTNPLESAFSAHEACSRRVKRWRNGNQALRWVAQALLEAEASFQPVGTPEALKQLADALSRYAARHEESQPATRFDGA